MVDRIPQPVIQAIRSGVQALVTLILIKVAAQWPELADITDGFASELVIVLTGVAVSLYVLAVRVLEERIPWLGFLNGIRRTPDYPNHEP